MMPWVLRAAHIGLCGLVLAACAEKKVIVARPPVVKKPPVRMAVLPIENDTYPKVATAINEAFKTVQFAGVDEYFRSTVTLDVVQLSIECVEPTRACFSAVGKSLNTNIMLLALIVPPPKRAKGLKLELTLFNVDQGVAIKEVERVFKKPDEAIAALGPMIADVVSPSTPPADGGR